jgi:hypothetical protein
MVNYSHLLVDNFLELHPQVGTSEPLSWSQIVL